MADKCRANGSGWCPSMENNLGEANARTKGLSVLITTHLETGQQQLYGPLYKKTSTARGVMLNHCPWCGVDLTPMHTGIDL